MSAVASAPRHDPGARHGVPVGPDAPVMEVLATMRAMRKLRPDPVDRATLERLVEAATWGPSGGNTQEYAFTIVDDRETMHAVGEVWRRTCRYYTTAQRPLPPPSTTQEAWDKVMDSLEVLAANFDETPALVVASYDMSGILKRMLRGYGHTLRGARAIGPWQTLRMLRHIPRFMRTGEAASIYPGVQNLLLAARALGLGATLTTWHTLYEPDYRRALGLPRSTRIYAIVPVGHPRGHFGPVSRRPAREAIRYTGG
ncbi:nitroreductase family protein [Conexibacter sp. SYSU D00693]|uniref:nitroreductase family protein n=1 Tax=Conexibacter sp. SYSU D00693 TaxID=2812560 RepID=UPI00196A66CB|nr:nitroreductase family protein [Conexibacter sp. SYSU D00693]